MSSNDNYSDILLEEIRDQNRAVLEAVGQMRETIQTLATGHDVARVEDKVDKLTPSRQQSKTPTRMSPH